MPAYHHGNLRQELLDAAVQAITERGVPAVTLRGLAAATGVSHAAPAHHFGDKAGLLTALATDGFERLGDALAAGGGDFLETGLAYVRFALVHPAHFEVMFQPALYHPDDDGLVAARARTTALLGASSRDASAPPTTGDTSDRALAGWCLVHGFASLVGTGAITPDGDAIAMARRLALAAFSPGGAGAGPSRSRR
ncbi:MAG TPA: TetR/AcrR family transcriptional regulator [Acidimicrobiales bacterium]|nr:TetR/AcrR family transcriptional regulator [Acidimicrobiales bacterium]